MTHLQHNIHMQINPLRDLPHPEHLLYPVLTLQTTILLPWSTQSQLAGNQGQLLCPSPLKLLRLAKAKPGPFSRGHNKGSCPCFPLIPSASWATVVFPHMALCATVCPPPQGTVSTSSFHSKWSPNLLALLYLKNTKTYIFKTKVYLSHIQPQ